MACQAQEIRVWVGMDWADEEHAFALRVAGTEKTVHGTIAQQPEALHEWLLQLREKAQGALVAIALEQSRGALIYGLMDYEFVRIYPLNPKTLAKYREAFYPSGSKSDPCDSDLILDFLMKHQDQLRLFQAGSVELRTLKMACERRRKMVNLRTGLTNQLTQNLKDYYPQALELAGALKEDFACDFLERWSDLAALQKAKHGRLVKFFRDHGRRALEEADRKITAVLKARALTEDKAIVTVGRMTTQSLVAQIRALNESIAAFDKQIAKIFQQHEDYGIFDSFPGCGEQLGPRLLATFGEDRERFDSAEQIQKMTGIAPVTKISGKTHYVQWRWACPRFIRQGIHEYANQSRHWCQWAAAYYKMQIERGKTHHKAVRALGFKWVRIMFRCWKERKPYDDKRYMDSLQANNAPLLAYL